MPGKDFLALMLKVGFHRAALVRYTGFKSSPYTEGALFYGEKLGSRPGPGRCRPPDRTGGGTSDRGGLQTRRDLKAEITRPGRAGRLLAFRKGLGHTNLIGSIHRNASTEVPEVIYAVKTGAPQSDSAGRPGGLVMWSARLRPRPSRRTAAGPTRCCWRRPRPSRT